MENSKDFTKGKSFFGWLMASKGEKWMAAWIHFIVGYAVVRMIQMELYDTETSLMIAFLGLVVAVYWIMQVRTYQKLKRGQSS